MQCLQLLFTITTLALEGSGRLAACPRTSLTIINPFEESVVVREAGREVGSLLVATPATAYTQCRLDESQVVARYFSVETSPYIGRPEGDQVVCRITLANPRLPWDRVEVRILVEYLPATASLPAAFSPCPEPPPQQLQHQLRVELEERREALPVVWPTGEQSASLEMLHNSGLQGGSLKAAASSFVAAPSCLLWLLFLVSQ